VSYFLDTLVPSRILGISFLPRAGEGDLVVLAPVQQVDVDELRSVVGVHPQDRERHLVGDVLECPKTHVAALLGTERFSVQPVAMSVTVSVNANWPAVLPPSWETRSISTNPGRASSSRPRCAPESDS
jgi:hypothetical protein